MRFFLSLIVMISISFFNQSMAQEPEDTTKTEKVIVTTLDGKERVGVILEDNGREILLLTESIGKIYIRKENISSIKPFSGEVGELFDGDYRTTGPFTTRYYFTTNALPIKKNEDYAMVHLYGPEVHFSLTDRFSLGIMSTWIASPFVLAAKYTIPTKNEKLNFGLGTLAGSSGYLNTFRGFGALHWGMMTYGTRMNNITFSAGYAYVQAGFKDEKRVPGTYNYTDSGFGYTNYPNIPTTTEYTPMFTSPVVSIAGVAKVGKKASFFFDSMVFFYSSSKQATRTQEEIIYDPITGYGSQVIISEVPDGNSTGTVIIAMPGMRFQQKENTAFQVALAGFTRISNGTVNAFPVPTCSWFFKF